MLLTVLSYNVGQGVLLGHGGHPKSGLVRKLEAGNRDIYREYTAYCRYKGKTVRSIERRRKMEFLLLYEPFSSLDYQTRLAVSADIYRIIRQEGKTALLVTHDISEAISMSDRVAVLTRRPARVKAVHDMGPLRGLPPMERRDTPEFHTFFNAIWKELELHDG